MVRRPVAFIAAIVLFAEAVGIVIINGVMATFVRNQDMSLAGMDPGVMANGTWATGGVFGLFLLLCGVLILLSGIRDRAPGRIARIVLICCAVIHGVLGALTVGLVGWAAFAFMMVVLGLIVLTLVAYGADREEPAAGAGTEKPVAPAPA
ncbi:hypothetical protein EES39_16820 [Streptomyces sp. ADI92-24]|uniref:hypothetical protein n=1 Tax=unclassified Streptomyces TaxID=2593676 RepID=UPI000FA87CD9|nr:MULTISPECIES: hypothetical protein [unclassified Streptomyces]MCX4770247.1 hypothetical protein [Streptomyces sp. NBC_01285]ROQ82355.1 hypothetical protein EDD95_1967 [Streptomyces sp. CEV 2-1]RPK44655.1 hypothetical protein EES39_16820 [Streptomyces sp. ADI92-24]